MSGRLFTQERYALRQLGAVVANVDHRHLACNRLEQEIATLPDCPERRVLLATFFAERQREAQALLDVRDGAAYVTQLAVPVPVDQA